jgi:poly(hydroxyalkanoate) granule-associated protein
MMAAHVVNEQQLASGVRDYAYQVWLAGLGAFSKTEKEGSRMFEAFVKRGEEVEERARKRAEHRVEEVRGRVEGVKGRANETWNKLEQVFQNRVARALNRLGVPNRYDIEELFRRLDVLQESVDKLIAAEEQKTVVSEEVEAA